MSRNQDQRRDKAREGLCKSRKRLIFPPGSCRYKYPGFTSLPSAPQSPSHPSPGGHCTYWSSRHPEPAGQMSSRPRTRRRRRRGTCPCGSAPAGPLLLLPRQQHQGWGLCATSSATLFPPSGTANPRGSREFIPEGVFVLRVRSEGAVQGSVRSPKEFVTPLSLTLCSKARGNVC